MVCIFLGIKSFVKNIWESIRCFSFSLKSVEGTSFDEARYRIIELISREAERFKFLKDSEGLSENDKNRYNAIISVNDGKYAMDEKLLISSLQIYAIAVYTLWT